MRKSIPYCYSLRRVEGEQPLDEVIEMSVDGVRRLYNFLETQTLAHRQQERDTGANTNHQALACFDFSFTLSCRLRLRPIEFASILEILWL